MVDNVNETDRKSLPKAAILMACFAQERNGRGMFHDHLSSLHERGISSRDHKN